MLDLKLVIKKTLPIVETFLVYTGFLKYNIDKVYLSIEPKTRFINEFKASFLSSPFLVIL